MLAIRLADRLHNMRTIAFAAPTRRYRVARETLNVIAPLARAAGLTDVSRELHDLSSAVLQPTSTAFTVTARTLSMLILLLPALTRTRWREEWHAELGTLPTRCTRTRFTLRVLLSTPRTAYGSAPSAVRCERLFTTLVSWPSTVWSTGLAGPTGGIQAAHLAASGEQAGILGALSSVCLRWDTPCTPRTRPL
ncbi:HD domain-containing protein [Streptomyces sp. NPDC047024]|uniref:HD domain-containing protein n=1 Tax=Streptomyces sp. NPDC047024 TaxID=3155476 RepID=UPI0033E1A55B